MLSVPDTCDSFTCSSQDAPTIPVILGQGRSLFAGAGKTGLKPLKTRQFT